MRYVLLASVSRLTPRRGSFDEAVVAFRTGRIRHCSSLLNGLDTTAAHIVRARADLRRGDPAAAVANLTEIVVESSRDRAEIALLLAVGLVRLGETARAHDLLMDAYVYSVSATDLALETEVEFYSALIALGAGQLDDARQMCGAGLGAASTPQLHVRPAGVIPIEHVVARIQELLGVIDAVEGKYQDQLVHARSALATLDGSPTRDVWQEAFALRNIAILTRDFDLEADARALFTRVPELEWTEDLRAVEFTTAEALGWCSALRGDGVGALRLFRQAASVAATDPERVIIGVDRALLARECGHTAMVTEEVEHALGVARAFRWEAAAGDTRYALLGLAQVAAPIAPARAREMLDRYSAIRNAMDMAYAARSEPRIRAEEAYSQGLVLRAEGRLAASAERLQVAFETWERIGYAWRAGRAALELAELEAGEAFRLAVRRELFRRPDSIFAERARLVA